MKYRNALPQLAGKQMITDGGLETTLIFHDGIDLPLFAAFKALETEAGMAAMEAYMDRFARIAVEAKRGFIMDTPTWRASARWASELEISHDELRAVHREAISTLIQLRTRFETDQTPFVINGVIGPQDDGYAPTRVLNAEQAETYHAAQIDWFDTIGADMVSAITLPYPDAAIGIASAAKTRGLPVAIAFTVETDGRLPSGDALSEALRQVDEAPDSYPAYYMINCAHPIHFDQVILNQGTWVERIRGIRANASMMSHAELDESETLDDGNPQDLGERFYGLRQRLPHLNILGGCCGTDRRHIEAICEACGPVVAS